MNRKGYNQAITEAVVATSGDKEWNRRLRLVQGSRETNQYQNGSPTDYWRHELKAAGRKSDGEGPRFIFTRSVNSHHPRPPLILEKLTWPYGILFVEINNDEYVGSKWRRLFTN